MVENYNLEGQKFCWKRFDKSGVRLIQDNSGFQQLGFQLLYSQRTHFIFIVSSIIDLRNPGEIIDLWNLFNHRLVKSRISNSSSNLHSFLNLLWLSKCSIQKALPAPGAVPPLAIRVFFKPPGFLWVPCLICFTVALGHEGRGMLVWVESCGK